MSRSALVVACVLLGVLFSGKSYGEDVSFVPRLWFLMLSPQPKQKETKFNIPIDSTPHAYQIPGGWTCTVEPESSTDDNVRRRMICRHGQDTGEIRVGGVCMPMSSGPLGHVMVELRSRARASDPEPSIRTVVHFGCIFSG